MLGPEDVSFRGGGGAGTGWCIRYRVCVCMCVALGALNGLKAQFASVVEVLIDVATLGF